MGMYHSTSGKDGFYYFHRVRTENMIPKEQLLKMLKKENDLRLGKDYQEKISQNDSISHFEEVTYNLQVALLKEFGYDKVEDQPNYFHDVFNYYKSARALFQGKDDDFKDVNVYFKYDKARKGIFKTGDELLVDKTDENVEKVSKSLENLTDFEKRSFVEYGEWRYKTAKVHALDTEKEIDFYKDIVLKSANAGRPLVVLAGSYTWPPFRQTVELVNKLYKEFKKSTDFVTIYISEAHAKDQWPLGNFVQVNQPKKLSERISICKSFIKDKNYMIPTYVDSMDNSFDNKFACWPDRYFIVVGTKMHYIPEPSWRFGFDRSLISNVLKNYFEKKKEEEEKIEEKKEEIVQNDK